MALSTVAKAAPSWRCRGRTGSSHLRRRCTAGSGGASWMRRLVASGSGSAAALIPGAFLPQLGQRCSRRQLEQSLLRRRSLRQQPWTAASAPRTARHSQHAGHAGKLGDSVRRVQRLFGGGVEVPAFRASDSAAVRVPARSRSWVAATLRASSVLPAEPSRSIRSNSPHSPRAVGPLTASGSNARDQLAEQVAHPNHRFVHAFDSTGGV